MMVWIEESFIKLSSIIQARDYKQLITQEEVAGGQAYTMGSLYMQCTSLILCPLSWHKSVWDKFYDLEMAVVPIIFIVWTENECISVH